MNEQITLTGHTLDRWCIYHQIVIILWRVSDYFWSQHIHESMVIVWQFHSLVSLLEYILFISSWQEHWGDSTAKWVPENQWPRYTPLRNGGCCLPCVLLANSGGNVMGAFVAPPFVYFTLRKAVTQTTGKIAIKIRMCAGPGWLRGMQHMITSNRCMCLLYLLWRYQPQLTIMSIQIPKANGILRQIKSLDFTVSFIVLTWCYGDPLSSQWATSRTCFWCVGCPLYGWCCDWESENNHRCSFHCMKKPQA